MASSLLEQAYAKSEFQKTSLRDDARPSRPLHDRLQKQSNTYEASFGLLLDSGEEIRSVLIDGRSDLLRALGKAIYRQSGTLLRVDASEILPTMEGRQAFSKIPSSLFQPLRSERRAQTAKTGVAFFFGTWPGEETDRDLLVALEEIRS